MSSLTLRARLLLWDCRRGSLPYDVVWLLVLALLFGLPQGWWGDPMVVGR